MKAIDLKAIDLNAPALGVFNYDSGLDEPCEEGATWLADGNPSLLEAWRRCELPTWMLWALTQLGLRDGGLDRRFACRCVRETPLADGRKVWDLLTDERSRRAVEVAERFVARQADEVERAAAWAAAWDAALAAARAAAGAAAWAAAWDAALAAARAAAGDAALAAARAAALAAARAAAGDAAGDAALAAARAAAGDAARAAAAKHQADILREVYAPVIDRLAAKE